MILALGDPIPLRVGLASTTACVWELTVLRCPHEGSKWTLQCHHHALPLTEAHLTPLGSHSLMGCSVNTTASEWKASGTEAPLAFLDKLLESPIQAPQCHHPIPLV